MCSICQHPSRMYIDSALLDGLPVATVAKQFDISTHALRKHRTECVAYTMSSSEFDMEVRELLKKEARVHPEAVEALEGFDRMPSISQTLQLREADLLSDTMKEYMVTLKLLGEQVKGIIHEMQNEEGRYKARGLLSKNICELYIAAGAEVRQCAKALSDMQRGKDGMPEGNGAPIIQIIGRPTP